MSKPDQKQYWDSNLDPHNLGGEETVTPFSYERELPFYLTPDQVFALEQIGSLKGRRVLEIGAGLGMNAMYMAKEGAKVVAFDIAHERLHTLMLVSSAMGLTLMPVKCSAESLPFRDGVFDVASSKSVLIHTRLEEALSEVKRTLVSGGMGVFIEPRTGNPLVNIYRRTLAPQIWRQITTYFGPEQISTVRKVFPHTALKDYYVLGFLAFIWQFAMPQRLLFKSSMAALGLIDKGLMGLGSFVRKMAWFVVMISRKD